MKQFYKPNSDFLDVDKLENYISLLEPNEKYKFMQEISKKLLSFGSSEELRQFHLLKSSVQIKI